MIIAYLDTNAKNISPAAQKDIISSYCADNKLVVDMFVEDDDMCRASANVKTSGHTFLTANIVGLGTTLEAVKNTLACLNANGFDIISVAEGFKFGKRNKPAEMLKGLDLAINIRSALSSVITKTVLSQKKNSGQKLGRAFGSVNKKYAWQGKEDLIKQRLLAGIPKTQIAKEIGISAGTLYNFIRANPKILNDKKE